MVWTDGRLNDLRSRMDANFNRNDRDIRALRKEMRGELAAVRQEMREEFAAARD